MSDVKSPQSAGSLRVLSVDDNADFANSLAALLQMNNYSVLTAYSGRDGFEIAVREHPQVGLLDLAMPGMDGYELARRLRQTGSTKQMLLIAITGFSATLDCLRSREAGFDHHLLKTAELYQIDRLLVSSAGRH